MVGRGGAKKATRERGGHPKESCFSPARGSCKPWRRGIRYAKEWYSGVDVTKNTPISKKGDATPQEKGEKLDFFLVDLSLGEESCRGGKKTKKGSQKGNRYKGKD